MRSGTSTRIALIRVLAASLLGVAWALAMGESAALAQDGADPCADLRGAAQGAPEPSLLQNAGAQGMWFPMATARLVLCEVRELRLRREEVRILAETQDVWALRVRLLEEQVGLAVEARNELGDVVGAAERRARDAEERASAWYRHPGLWFALGVVGTVAIFAAGIAALNAIR